MELWPKRPFAWPLILLAVPAFVGQFYAIHGLRGGPTNSNWSLHPFCLFLSRTPVVWSVAAIWFVVDLFLIAWASRCLRRNGEPARPAGLFFLWQGAKFAFFLLYFAVMFTYRPFQPVFYHSGFGN